MLTKRSQTYNVYIINGTMHCCLEIIGILVVTCLGGFDEITCNL